MTGPVDGPHDPDAVADPGGAAVARLLLLPLGTRVVVRYRVGELATDALGTLLARSTEHCDIRTRRGDVTVPLRDILAAKAVPPRPPPRPRPAPAPPPPGDDQLRRR